ncbi:MAG: alkaline phosphatase PhoX [Acidimicrobiia bacterium]
MGQTRRAFLRQSGLATLGAGIAASGSMASVIAAARPAGAERAGPGFTGYGPLQPDPDGILDLPAGFSYKAFSREREPLTGGGFVPSSHDGMAAFPAGTNQTYLVRNHELNAESITEDGLTAVEHVAGSTYDPAGRRRHHHAAHRPGPFPGEPSHQPVGHARQLRRRADAVGQLADV